MTKRKKEEWEKAIDAINKKQEDKMNRMLKNRLKIAIPVALLPAAAVGLLWVFVPLFVSTYEIKWIIYAILYVFALILIGYLLYKFRTRDL